MHNDGTKDRGLRPVSIVHYPYLLLIFPHPIRRLHRDRELVGALLRKPELRTVVWRDEAGLLDKACIGNVDGAVAGGKVVGGRW
jgi:hypothetical protein